MNEYTGYHNIICRMFPPGSAGSTERRLREVRVQGSVFHHEQLDAIVAILRALKDTDVEVLFLL